MQPGFGASSSQPIFTPITKLVILSGGDAFAAGVEGPAVVALTNISRRIRNIDTLAHLHRPKHHGQHHRHRQIQQQRRNRRIHRICPAQRRRQMQRIHRTLQPQRNAIPVPLAIPAAHPINNAQGLNHREKTPTTTEGNNCAIQIPPSNCISIA